MSQTPFADYVTTKEAAKLLGVSKSRVDQFHQGKRLVGIDTPLGRMFRKADVLAFKKRPRAGGRPKIQGDSAT